MYRDAVMPYLSFFIVASRAPTARVVRPEVPVDASPPKPVKRQADRRPHCSRIVALEPVQQVLSYQAPDIRIADIDNGTSISAAAAVTPPCGASHLIGSPDVVFLTSRTWRFYSKQHRRYL